jgi:hypothetical protein
MYAAQHHYVAPEWAQAHGHLGASKTGQSHVRGHDDLGLLRQGVRVVMERPSYGLHLDGDDLGEGWSVTQQPDPDDINPDGTKPNARGVWKAGRIRY